MTRAAFPENYQRREPVEIAGFQSDADVTVVAATTKGIEQYGSRYLVTDTRADAGGLYVQVPLSNFTFAGVGIDTSQDLDIGCFGYLSSNIANAGLRLYAGAAYISWSHNTTTQGVIVGNNLAYSANKLKSFASSGGATLDSTFTACRFFVDSTSAAATLGCAGVWVGQRARTKVVLAWDDSIDDSYDVGFTRMEPYGMRGTVYMLSEPYWGLSSAEVAEMSAAGWEFALHGPIDAEASDLVTKYSDDYDDMRADIQGVWDSLIANGVTVSPHYAYPLGANSANLRKVLSDMGIKTGRLAGSPPFMPTVPMWPDLFRVQSVSGNGSYATTKGHIDKAAQYGTSLIISHHATTDADFVQVVAYLNQLQQQGVLDVVTMSEFYAGMSGLRIPVTRV